MKFAKTLLIGVSSLALGTGAALAADKAKADKNGDGKLSRTEYLTVMTKKDLKSAKDKVAGNKDKDRNAATGSSKSK